MKKKLLVIIGMLLTVIVKAQQEIKMDDLSKHVGDSIKVCAKIYGGVYLDRTNGTPTFLNAGGNYPDAPLTIVIWADVRKSFKDAPEVFYKDKEVCIFGKIKLYKEKPEIVVYDEKQLVTKM